MQRIKILDSLRGLAALIVVFHHVFTRFPFLFANTKPAFLIAVFQCISDCNVEAVMFFFFISGFSICLSLKNKLPVSKVHLNEYVHRRLKRILPLYYLAIAFTYLCGFITNSIYNSGNFNIKILLGNLFFLQCSPSYKGNWFPPYGDNGPLWSLSFEMFYYLFLPLFLMAFLQLYRKQDFTGSIHRRALLASLAISLVCTIINKYFFVPYIAFGTLFYVWYSGFFVGYIFRHPANFLNVNLLWLLFITLITGTLYYFYKSATVYKLAFGAIVSTSFYLAYLSRKKLPASIVAGADGLMNCLFYFIGRGSYAIYLLHYPFLLLLQHHRVSSLFSLVIALLIFFIVCIFLEKFIARIKWLWLQRAY